MYNGDFESDKEKYEKEAYQSELRKIEAQKKARKEYDELLKIDQKANKILPKIFEINWITGYRHLNNQRVRTLVVGPNTSNISDANSIFLRKAHELGLNVKQINSIVAIGDCIADLQMDVPSEIPDEWRVNE